MIELTGAASPEVRDGSSSGKRIYIDCRKGLCNRLEIHALACAFQREFGHEIVLGWPELDALHVEGTRLGRPGFWGRWRAVRVRHCNSRLFEELRLRRNIILRDYDGPREKMAAVYREAASRLWLTARMREAMLAVFRRLGERPLVGVHLRRADFPLLSKDLYDLRQAPLSAVPLWWFEWAMKRIVECQPDVRFLLCHNGDVAAVSTLRGNFDVVELALPNPYRDTDHPGYRAAQHPVADLFGLACCPVILATPVSSFSHYAANVLGPESICLMPPMQTTRAAPAMVRARVHGKLLFDWFDAALRGRNVDPVAESLGGIEFSHPPQYGWL